MPPPPLVSAVIPTRNRAQLVTRAVRSALGQTYQSLEVVVVVDGPDPETIEALQVMNENRVRIVALPESVGGSEARNAGVRAAAGEWVALLDDDDWWAEEKIERQIAAADHSKAIFPIISCRHTVHADETDTISPQTLYKWPMSVSDYIFCRRFLSTGGGTIHSSGLLAPKGLFDADPFTKGLKRHQDWDWVLRVASRNDTEIIMLPESLWTYDISGIRKRISSHSDLEFSRQWIRRIRPLITRRAYSHFLGTFCSSLASSADAGAADYISILREMVQEKAVYPSPLLLFATHAVLSNSRRAHIWRLLKSSRRAKGSNNRPGQVAVSR